MGFTFVHTCDCGHDLREHDDYFAAEAIDGKFACNTEGCFCLDFTQTIQPSTEAQASLTWEVNTTHDNEPRRD